jgi:hypothetical protein
MPIITIIKAFTLTFNDGKQQRFEPGAYDLEPDVADHWYVKAHSNKPPKVTPPVGTPEYAHAAARKVARRRVIEAAAEEQEDAEE